VFAAEGEQQPVGADQSPRELLDRRHGEGGLGRQLRLEQGGDAAGRPGSSTSTSSSNSSMWWLAAMIAAGPSPVPRFTRR